MRDVSTITVADGTLGEPLGSLGSLWEALGTSGGSWATKVMQSDSWEPKCDQDGASWEAPGRFWEEKRNKKTLPKQEKISSFPLLFLLYISK